MMRVRMKRRKRKSAEKFPLIMVVTEDEASVKARISIPILFCCCFLFSLWNKNNSNTVLVLPFFCLSFPTFPAMLSFSLLNNIKILLKLLHPLIATLYMTCKCLILPSLSTYISLPLHKAINTHSHSLIPLSLSLSASVPFFLFLSFLLVVYNKSHFIFYVKKMRLHNKI